LGGGRALRGGGLGGGGAGAGAGGISIQLARLPHFKPATPCPLPPILENKSKTTLPTFHRGKFLSGIPEIFRNSGNFPKLKFFGNFAIPPFFREKKILETFQFPSLSAKKKSWKLFSSQAFPSFRDFNWQSLPRLRQMPEQIQFAQLANRFDAFHTSSYYCVLLSYAVPSKSTEQPQESIQARIRPFHTHSCIINAPTPSFVLKSS
jgi:hypothetical protein